jgi:cell division transport system permease protein
MAKSNLPRKAFYFLPVRERGNRFLPVIIGVMVFLAAVAGAAALALFNATAAWSGSLARSLTVQIVQEDAATRTRETERALAVLKQTPGVERAAALAQKDLVALLEPWLGKGNVTDDLPVPAMIAVTLKEGVHVDAAALGARLKEAAPDAALDDHHQWIGNVAALARMVETAAAVSLLLIMLTTVAIVVFATKAALAVHRETVEIVHSLGARDGRIAGEFRTLFMWHGLKGSGLGLLLAAITLALFAYLANRIGGGLLPEMRLAAGQALYFVALPFLTAGLTMLTADVTVRKALRRLV